MPVSFLTASQREGYGHFVGSPSPEDLARFFHLDEADQKLIAQKRGNQSRLGFALQLTTLRYLGTFLDSPANVPVTVVQTLSRQLGIQDQGCLAEYKVNRLRWTHTVEIRKRFGYKDFTDSTVGLRLSRWIYSLCWTGAERPSVLFERAIDWLLAHKVLIGAGAFRSPRAEPRVVPTLLPAGERHNL